MSALNVHALPPVLRGCSRFIQLCRRRCNFAMRDETSPLVAPKPLSFPLNAMVFNCYQNLYYVHQIAENNMHRQPKST
jgi:hypothetical protein